ncbi:MAG TPA: undecaprenyldiphospho-muramoylpentapeptide beta-N-acetylglucosaminyltransferase [Vicinamibacteria bacterium]|nr:undecaprenyldiphospho-muramoylpentapeptide beta-N-acetylglucosaminyltransferase [Vicinamibacteria bacterium]
MGPITLLVAAGGTGGHLYPAVAVAERFRDTVPESRVVFVGTERGLESRIVPAAGFPLELIRAAPLRGGSMGRKLSGLFGLATGWLDARRLLGRIEPRVVMGLGAYVSGTVLLTAALRGIPTLVLEPNAVPGLANRWLAPFVDEAACAFADTTRFFGKKGVVTGNPVRESIVGVPPLSPQTSSTMKVLVFGGSQGSVFLNRTMTEAVARLAAGIAVTHQTGSGDLDAVREAYAGSSVPATVFPYIDDMARAYAEADLVVARAGATTCAELAAAGRGSLLVPLPLAGGHQQDNAEMMTKAGAARTVRQAELTANRLASELASLLSSPEERESMAARARSLARPDAARNVTERLIRLARNEVPA